MLLAQKRGNFAPALKILIRTSVRQLNISPKPTPSARPDSRRCLAWLAVCSWPDRDNGSDPAAGYSLHLSLLGNLQCVVNLDAEVSNGALELGVAQE